MEHVFEAAGFSPRELLLCLFDRLDLSGQGLFGWFEHDLASLRTHLEFVAIVHVERLPDFLRKRDHQLAVANLPL